MRIIGNRGVAQLRDQPEPYLTVAKHLVPDDMAQFVEEKRDQHRDAKDRSEGHGRQNEGDKSDQNANAVKSGQRNGGPKHGARTQRISRGGAED